MNAWMKNLNKFIIGMQGLLGVYAKGFLMDICTINNGTE